MVTDGSDDETGGTDDSVEHPEWPPSRILLSQLIGLGERVRQSPLSEAWERASEVAAARLFEWWIDAGGDDRAEARELFERRQVVTGSDDAAEPNDDDEPPPSGWISFVQAAGSLLEASRQAASALAREGASEDVGLEALSEKARKRFRERWQHLTESYPGLTRALLEAAIESSKDPSEFESPGRTVVTSSDGDDDASESEDWRVEQLWSHWLDDEGRLTDLADRAVSVAFRELFVGEDESFGAVKSGPGIDTERASGFMRALERTMMGIVESAMFDDSDQYPSGSKGDRADSSTDQTDA